MESSFLLSFGVLMESTHGEQIWRSVSRGGEAATEVVRAELSIGEQ